MSLQPGTRLGHYRVSGRVGAGGMGEVYRAHDENLHRDVALKVLTERLAGSADLRERFEREARAVAALSHPNILTIFDFGHEGSTAFAITELLEGETLRQRLAAHQPLPLPAAVAIARDIAGGLAAAHSKRIVHRDIKPENTFLTAAGTVKILDFGLARSTGDPIESIAETLVRDQGAEVTPGASPALTSPGALLGTSGYMSPEQARGEMATTRSDVFALGCVLYEMLSGRAPFTRGTQPDTLKAILSDEPPPLDGLAAKIPRSVVAVLRRCLAKDPRARYSDATALFADLDAACHELEEPAPIEARSIVASLRRPAVAIPLLLLIAIAGFGIYRWNERRAREAWARQTAIPEAQRLEGENRRFEAYEIAKQAEAVLGDDAALAALWPLITTPFHVVTDPPGASISYRPYSATEEASTPDGAAADAGWRALGSSPYQNDHFPVGTFRIRIEKEGFEPIEVARSLLPGPQIRLFVSTGVDFLADASYAIDVELAPIGSLPAGMILVSGGLYLATPLMGFDAQRPIEVPAFFIDRTEVTNRGYHEFVEAGGYSNEGVWRQPIDREGVAVPTAEAMAAFRDSTGRAGPGAWVLGAPAVGTEDLPVSGVSWFEADAYCHWRGVSLPTLYHWARATLPSSDVWIPFTPALIGASNVAGTELLPVGSRPGIGVSGAYDLAGNVREWTATASGAQRYILGGAWSEPVYTVNEPVATSPWDRSSTNGFRCARYPEGEAPAPLRATIDTPEQDFTREVTMPDEVFATEHRFYTYDHTQPLRASVDSSRRLDWGATEEWVSIDAAYGGERLPLRLHLPDQASGAPSQVVLFFGGSNLLFQSELGDSPDVHFLVRSGRAVVEPVYDGTFQRNDGRTLQRWGQIDSPSRRELVLHWAQDLGRAIDYFEQRPGFDATSVAFVGLSLGSALSPNLLAHEPRVRAAILWSGGFGVVEPQESLDARIALARRTTIPILMLAGARDTIVPTDPNQRAMFRWWGTPEQDKRMVIYENAAHWPLPMNEVIRESVDFLDQYLGPAKTGP